MKLLDTFTKRRAFTFALLVVGFATLLSVIAAPVSSLEKPSLKTRARLADVMPWSTRTYSNNPVLNQDCAAPKINVVVLVDRNTDIADADSRDGVTDPIDTEVGKIKQHINYLAWGAIGFYDPPANPTGTVNMMVYAYATNVVAQFKGAGGSGIPGDTDGDGIVDTPANSTQGGVPPNTPVTDVSNINVITNDFVPAVNNIYFKKTGDPDAPSSNPTDLQRGYGSTPSPQGTGEENTVNALDFAAHLVKQKQGTPQQIDAVFLLTAASPSQNNGYNQVQYVYGDSDLGVFNDTSAFNSGGLNNTNARIVLPETASKRSLTYVPPRESDIWDAANVVEALRTGNPVADLSKDSVSAASTIAGRGLYTGRNPIQLNVVSVGRINKTEADPTTAARIFGAQQVTDPTTNINIGGYTVSNDFHKNENFEKGWITQCSPVTPTSTANVSVGISGDNQVTEGNTLNETVTLTNTSSIPVKGYVQLDKCGPTSHYFDSTDPSTLTFGCSYVVPLGGPTNFDITGKITDLDGTAGKVYGVTAPPGPIDNSGSPQTFDKSITVNRTALPS